MNEENNWRALIAEVSPEQSYPQGWYVVALSGEVEADRPLGCDFLNGRVAVYRRASGAPVVLTSRCPHMGTDLSLGAIVGEDLRCPYHHFCFGPAGDCTKVPSEGPIPAAAKVFSYPCVEKFGLIWAFNGETPLFPPPEIEGYAESALIVRARRFESTFTVAPWLLIANSFDLLHLRYVHRLEFAFDHEDVRWSDHQVNFELELESPEMPRFKQRVRLDGTNVVSYQNTVAGATTIGLTSVTPVGSVAPMYFVAAMPRDEGLSSEEIDRRLQQAETFADELTRDDLRTLTGMRFKVGTLLKEDRSMAKFMRWVSEFPTANPAAAFQ